MCFGVKFSITQFNPTWPGYGLTVLCKKRWLTALGKKSVGSFHSLNSSPFRPNLLTQKHIKQKDKEKNHQNENTKTNKYKAKPNMHKVEIKKQSSLCGVTLIVQYSNSTASTTWFI